MRDARNFVQWKMWNGEEIKLFTDAVTLCVEKNSKTSTTTNY